MIYAKTGMELMPECCAVCRQRTDSVIPGFGLCGGSDLYCPDEGRLEQCPLTEIDETMPAQLATAKADVAAAEARCAKFGRLLDAND